MTSLLIALVGVLLAPLLIGKWRASLLGLVCQGGLMAWIAYRLGVVPDSARGLLTLADLALVRGLFAPIALWRVMGSGKAPTRNEVIPPNLLSWTLAFGLVLVGFNFARAMVPDGGEQRMLVATATTALLLGFVVLSSQAGTFSLIVGALRFENAIALFELGGQGQPSLSAQIGQSLVVVATIFFYRWYLTRLGRADGLSDGAIAEGPTL